MFVLLLPTLMRFLTKPLASLCVMAPRITGGVARLHSLCLALLHLLLVVVVMLYVVNVPEVVMKLRVVGRILFVVIVRRRVTPSIAVLSSNELLSTPLLDNLLSSLQVLDMASLRLMLLLPHLLPLLLLTFLLLLSKLSRRNSGKHFLFPVYLVTLT